MSEEIEKYRELVKSHADGMDGIAFYNGTTEHAAVILENIFRTAELEVCILTKQLDPSVYGRAEVVSELTKFLSRNGSRVRILHEEDAELCLDAGNPFVAKLCEHKSQYTARRIDRELGNVIDYRFVAADRKSYRYQPDKTKRWQAIAAFNDVRNAAKLTSNFDQLEQMSQ